MSRPNSKTLQFSRKQKILAATTSKTIQEKVIDPLWEQTVSRNIRRNAKFKKMLKKNERGVLVAPNKQKHMVTIAPADHANGYKQFYCYSDDEGKDRVCLSVFYNNTTKAPQYSKEMVNVHNCETNNILKVGGNRREASGMSLGLGE